MGDVRILGASGHPIHAGIAAMNQKSDMAQQENEAAMTLEFDRMALKPGETLVIRPSLMPTQAELEQILLTAKRAVPEGVSVLLVAPGTGVMFLDGQTTDKLMAEVRASINPIPTH